ncbi:MAG: prepilin-type N-terminal cleavage/methylation domain-containing protein [Burkholderiales bacterium]|nr:prepilin-type N-terminal cleavage/methylation domain-containing protein [Burkholderiales bacterium]
MQNKVKNKNNSGYTIIETMIAISLFLIVVMIGMGSLLNTTLIHGKSQDMRSIVDNLSFIMEDISRNVRTGYDFAGGGNIISFTSSNGAAWSYKIEGSNLSKSIDGGTNWTQLNSGEITFKNGSGFSLTGVLPPPGDTLQPLITVRLVGEIISKDNISTPFSLQTSISQRLADIVTP